MIRRLAYPIAVLILLTAAARMHAAVVTVQLSVAGTPEAAAGVAGTAEARPADGESVRQSSIDGGKAVFDLLAGVWYIDVKVNGFWSEQSVVVVEQAAATTSILLHPAAQLRAEVEMPKGSREPSELNLTFQSSPGDALGMPRRTMVCPVSERVVRCVIPAGQLDLNLRLPGHVSHYFWARAISAGRTLNLGTLRFRPGATLVGSVSINTRAPRSVQQQLRVTVTPDPRAMNEEQKRRAALGAQTTKPNARGFFHFVLEPGGYLLKAEAGNLVSVPREVTIVAGHEAQLREPLIVDEPRKLVLNVEPVTDPWNKPWRIMLSRAERDATIEVGNEVTSELGEVTFEGLLPGLYYWRAVGARETKWANGEIELVDDSRESVKIPLHRVEGTLKYAGLPLQAIVLFGGRRGTLTIPAKSDEEGHYEAILPIQPDDRWTQIDVEAAKPFVRRRLRDVEIDRPEDPEKPARLDLDLDGTSLTVEVVDTEGNHQRQVQLNVLAADGESQQLYAEEGFFSLAGLPPGKTLLRAECSAGESDQPTEVELVVDADPPQHEKMVVAPWKFFEVVVRSEAAPVGMATVSFSHPEDPSRPLVPLSTDPEGKLRFPIPARTEMFDLSINAPGYAFRMMRMATRNSGRPILVSPLGGSLTIEAPREAGALAPYVFHQGAVLHALAVAMFADARTDPGIPADRVRFTVPRAEEGRYVLCMISEHEKLAAMSGNLPASRCTAGELAPFGALALKAPEVDAQPKLVIGAPAVHSAR